MVAVIAHEEDDRVVSKRTSLQHIKHLTNLCVDEGSAGVVRPLKFATFPIRESVKRALEPCSKSQRRQRRRSRRIAV